MRPNAADQLIVGIDGGNSKTDVVLATADGHLLGWLRTTGSNPQGIGLAATNRLIRTAIDSLLGSAQRPGVELSVLSLCMAGIDTPRDAEAVRSALRERGERSLAQRIATRNDSEAGLRVATDDGVGIALVGGAGVNAIGVNERGVDARFAALGDISGDFGGGGGIAVAGVGAAVRAEERRGPKTSLGRAILASTGHSSLRELLDAILDGTFDQDRIGALAPVVLQQSERGDHVAREIEAYMIKHAVAYATASQLRAPIKRRPIPVVLIGGTLNAPLRGYQARIRSALRAALPPIDVRPLRAAPALGALLYALDAAEPRLGQRRIAEEKLRVSFTRVKPRSA